MKEISVEMPEPLESISFLKVDIWMYLMKQTWREIQKFRVNYLFGLFACILVVMSISMLITISQGTPLIFLSMAQAQMPENDLMIRPYIGKYLNYSFLKNLLNASNEIYNSPRIVLNTYWSKSLPNFNPHLYSIKTINESLLENGDKSNSSMPEKNSVMVALDFEQEKKIELGINWRLPAPDIDSIYINNVFAKKLNVSIGDSLYLLLCDDIRNLLESIVKSGDFTKKTSVKMRISGIFDKFHGKFDSSYNGKSIVLINYKTWIYKILSSINQESEPSYIKNNKTEYTEFASQLFVNLPPSRVNVYSVPDIDIIQKSMVEFSNSIMYKLGFNRVHSSVPILEFYRDRKFLPGFIKYAFNIAALIIISFSGVLIQSILKINIESFIYDLGILRIIGLPRKGIIALVILKALSYSISAPFFGLMLSYIIYKAINYAIFSNLGVRLSPNLSYSGIFVSLAMNIIVPLVSTVLPAREALAKSITDMLERQRRNAPTVKITVERSKWRNTHYKFILIGFAISLITGVIIYILPLGLITMNISLLLNVFLCTLIAVLISIIMINTNFEHFFQKIIIYIFLFWENSALRFIVLKNLIIHKEKNRKTILISSILLSVIIFANIAYTSQISMIVGNRNNILGAAISCCKSSDLNYDLFYTTLEKLPRVFPNIVDGVAWNTKGIVDYDKALKTTYVTNTGRLSKYPVTIYGITSNYYQVANSEFLKVDASYYKTDPKCISSFLYKEVGAALVGSTLRTQLAAKLGDPLELVLEYSKTQNISNCTDIGIFGKSEKYARIKPIAFLGHSPKFKFNKFAFLKHQNLLVSIPTFSSLLGKSPSDIEMECGSIKVKSSSTKDINTVIKWVYRESNISLTSYKIFEEYYLNTNKLMRYFFNFIIVISMVISFFSLISSMHRNIRDQRRDIGISLAIGMPKIWIYKIYAYEAFLVVFNGSLLGILIGSILSFGMIYQEIMFTDIYIHVKYPWDMILIVLLCSIFFSLLSVLSPIRNLFKNPIIKILNS